MQLTGHDYILLDSFRNMSKQKVPSTMYFWLIVRHF